MNDDEEVSDEEIKQLEEELKKLEEKDSSYGSPKATEKESLFKFFKRILSVKDTTRIGNLTAAEIGIGRLSVRGYKSIALYAEAEGLDLVSNYLNDLSNVITESSMSKKGFWPQLFVTQIKREKKDKDKSQERKRLFGRKPQEEGE